MSSRTTYKSAGVDVELKERLIPEFRTLAGSTPRARVLGGIGGFGAMVRTEELTKMRSPVLVAGTDSVGTKLLIAFATGRHNTVGVDCVAMCANDIICHGARPLFFLDYIGTGKLDPSVATAIIEGVARGCREAGMSLVGGETAQLPGLYRRGQYDLAGFAVGLVERSRIPSPARIRKGDALVGIASNGLHSNGFSLARKVLIERSRFKLDRLIPDLGCTLGEELLRPTLIYARIARKLFDRFEIRGLANITGGGLVENLPRVMPPGLRAVIRRGSWPVPPIFGLIAHAGRVDRAEMDRTFNNGLGMVAIVPEADAGRMVRYLRRYKYGGYVVGEVQRGRRAVVFA